MGRVSQGSISVEWKGRGWRALGARMQNAALAALEGGTLEVLPIVKSYAPVGETGELRESLKVGPAIPYGPSRVQISIISSSPYFLAVTRGVEAQTVGKEGKFYGSKARNIAFVGQWNMPARSANNFPKRAIRENLPRILGIYKKNIVTRLRGPG